MNPGGRLEVVPAIAAGVIASAIALVGFGLDSVMECAAAVVVGQLRGENQDRETRAVPPDRYHLLRPGADLAVGSIRDLTSHARLCCKAWPSR